MWNVTAFLCALIGATVPLSFLNGSFVPGLASALASLCLLTAIFAIRPGELAFLKSVTRVYLLVGLVPPLWIVIQMLPIAWLAHPVWKLAAETLERPLRGSISIDIGASLGALLTYMAGFAVSLTAAAVAVDPRRARLLANAVIGTVAVSAALSLVPGTAIAAWLVRLAPIVQPQPGELIGIILAGIPVSVASALEDSDTSGGRIRSLLSTVVAVFATASIGWSTGFGGAIPIVAGIALLLMIWVARRFRFHLWSTAGVAATMAGIGIAIAVTHRTPDVPFAIAFSSAPQAVIQSMQNLLADLPVFGTGAGTIGALVPTYMDWQGSAATPITASAASAAIAEIGATLFWASLVAVALAICVLATGALSRGRNWSFAAGAAAALLSLALAAFALPTILSLQGIVVLGAIVGSSVSQRVSRQQPQNG